MRLVIAEKKSVATAIAQAKAWFNGSDGPDNVCQAYPDGQCTWWACMRGHKNGLDVGSYWGNGGDWAASATAAGWKTTRTDPVAGSIVSYPPGVAGADTLYGHVAIVESVDAKAGTVTISEMNGHGVRLRPLTKQPTIRARRTIRRRARPRPRRR